VATLLTGNLAARGAARAAGVSASRPLPTEVRTPQQRAHRILSSLQHAPVVIAYVSDLDRAGHAGDPEAKRELIERIDRDLVKPLADAVQRDGDLRLTILSDFATPCTTRRHLARPSPFLDVDPRRSRTGPGRFTEEDAAATGRQRFGPVDCRGWLWGG
jgi:2,3-bisphosphoglycerate-independent phosphoglycerate mutase